MYISTYLHIYIYEYMRTYMHIGMIMYNIYIYIHMCSFMYTALCASVSVSCQLRFGYLSCCCTHAKEHTNRNGDS